MEHSTVDRSTQHSDAKRERYIRHYGQFTSVKSISRRFSYALIGIVTLVLFAFAIIAIFLNTARIDDELEARLDNALKLAQISLPTPLWNLDNDVVEDFLGALFLDEAMVYAKVLWGGQAIVERKSQGFDEEDFSSPELFFVFISNSSDILFEGSIVGAI